MLLLPRLALHKFVKQTINLSLGMLGLLITCRKPHDMPMFLYAFRGGFIAYNPLVIQTFNLSCSLLLLQQIVIVVERVAIYLKYAVYRSYTE